MPSFWLRTLIGSALMVCVLIAARRLPACLPKGADLVYLAASGAAMGASWIFLYEAYRLVGVGISSLAYYCAPIMVMILSPFLFKERLYVFQRGRILHRACWSRLGERANA